MSDNITEEIYEQIDDLILGLLSHETQKEIEILIANNSLYKKYYLEQKELIELSQPDDIPDPGADYWESFPAQVIEKARKKQSESISDEMVSLNHSDTIWKKLSQWLNSNVLQNQVLVTGIALSLVVVIVTTLTLKSTDTEQYTPLTAQQLIWEDTHITGDVLEKLQTDSPAHYGFSNIESINMYAIGRNFSLSIAYFIQQNNALSIRHLISLEKLNLDDSLSSLINSIKQNNANKTLTYELYNNLNTQLKKRFEPDEYALFKTGIWLLNSQLAISSGKYHLLKELNEADLLMKKLKPLALPESVYMNLQLLNTYFSSEEFNQNKIQEINQLLENIHNILS